MVRRRCVRFESNEPLVAVEDVIRKHASIADAAVVGLPDRDLGELVTAFVELKPGCATPTLADVQRLCRDELAPYKVPRALRIVDALPRNALGKVLKSALKSAA